MKKTVRGFTLVELLVVVAIMAITGAYAFSNLGSFGEDQKLKSAAQDVQSLLRLAQSNATSNAKCDSQYSAKWQVVFIDATTVNLNCQEPLPSPPPSPLPTPTPKKTLKMDTNNSSISLSGTSCPSGAPSLFKVTFDPLTGKINFVGYSRCMSLTITLTNSRAAGAKSLIIEQGGRIYAQ